MNYKLVATDLDGTLLNAKSTVSEANIKALQWLVDQGVSVAIASGRRFADFALNIARSIERPIYLVLCNGAVVVAPDLKTLLLRKNITRTDFEWLVGLGCDRNNVHWHIYADELDLLWRREDGGPFLPEMPDEVWRPVSSTKELLNTCEQDMLRVRMWANNSELSEMMESAKGRFELCRYPYPSEIDRYVEFMAPGVSKSAALRFVAEHLGFGLEDVIAFGDGTNDVDMLSDVGLGIAMANATDEAKSAAKMVVGHHDEDGVAKAIEQLFK